MHHVMRPAALSLPRRGRGFTLIEFAIALFIVTLALGSLLVPLTVQVAKRKTEDTSKTLEEIREALLGFAATEGRLPCPASSTSNGVESFCTNGGTGACGTELPVPPNTPQGHGRCANPYNGFAPGVTLGVAALDAQGYAVDAWGTRIRYVVTTANLDPPITGAPQYDFTASSGIRLRAQLLGGLSKMTPDLHVCASSIGITATTCGSATELTGTSTEYYAPAVIFSLGTNRGASGGADETANLAGTQVFVSRVQAGSGTTGGEFDDIVTWLPKSLLFSRMLSADQLP